MNNVVLVGRLAEEPKVNETENGKQLTTVNVAVTRNYKNPEGIYETDFIRCILWNGVASNTCEYCHIGDVIGIKGRLQTGSYENAEKQKVYYTEVVAERVTFLSSAKPKEVNEEVSEANEVKSEAKKSSKKKKADE